MYEYSIIDLEKLRTRWSINNIFVIEMDLLILKQNFWIRKKKEKWKEKTKKNIKLTDFQYESALSNALSFFSRILD